MARHHRGACTSRIRRRAHSRVRVSVASSRPPRPRSRFQGLRPGHQKHPLQDRVDPMCGSALRIGVAGAGNIASIAQLPTLVARDDVELQGLVTRKDDPQPLMRRWGFRRAYPTVEALLETEELDALFVLTARWGHD